MSDDVLSVIPTDPHWQPTRAAADLVASLVEDLAPGLPDGAEVEIDVTWYDTITAVDCGGNLQGIGCPHCGGSIGVDWWADLLEAHCDDGFTTLATVVPCCGTATTLNALEYDWPCGFARFEAAIWNPARTWFGEEELTVIGEALGHPVRQVRAHI
ncbi:hypothetical protein [Streptomyces fructofermentans]|uniref:Uncharacterized protein n=1 Tax=Streptomyces fructofermentans TaxID=152141 RepID=A0A918KJ19_9ACTN|nr:hypothetical protein [Streptomyces fructofermentans]GGX63608.1 hypothetical protein GCM10010515_34120 [Streptomyces fructofermentans]